MDTIVLVDHKIVIHKLPNNIITEINECAATSSPCEHTCTNTVGSFQCSCNDGYLLDDDGRSCDGTLICNNVIVTVYVHMYV